MNLKPLFAWSAALCLGVATAQARQVGDAGSLEKKLQQMQETFERRQREMRESFEKMIRDQQAQIEALKLQLTNTLKAVAAAPAAVTPPAGPPPVTPEEWRELNGRVDQVVDAQKKSRPNEFNPSIGLVGETVFSYRTRGSDDTGADRFGGFDVNQRSLELNIAASVDPFAKGYAVVNASADAATGEANLAVEEAALQTTSLPANLELKVGRFFGEFGRLAYIHDHELPFVNRPLVLDRYIGGESKTDGLQLNWLPPVAHYISVTAGVGDQFGDDPNNPGHYRPFAGLNFFGRIATYFELTPDWQIETGISGLLNPSTQDRGGVVVLPDASTLTEKDRRLAGVDFKLTYVPLANNQFKSLTWGTELLYSDNRYLFDPDGSLNPGLTAAGRDGDESMARVGSFGLYSYVTYKWSRQWSAGFLFDWVQDAQNRHGQTFAYSPYLTFALSHWNQLRLQYTHTEPEKMAGLRSDDAIYLQWEWIIGSHSHGWQQR